MMESTPSRDNRDIIIDVTLFAENLATVSNGQAEVFAFLLFIFMAVLALKTAFEKIITFKNYTTNSLIYAHIIIIWIGTCICKRTSTYVW